MLYPALAVLVLLLLLPLLLLALRRRLPAPPESPFAADTPLPYTARPLMTVTELQVYDRLLRALPDYMVFAQVQVSRVLESPEQDNLYWFNFINRLSYDFVVCDTDGIPLAAIEIDDDTHQLPERAEADHRKNRATEAAGIAMLRWQVREIPNLRQIQKIIRELDTAA